MPLLTFFYFYCSVFDVVREDCTLYHQYESKMMKIYCLNRTLMRQKAVGEKDCMCQFSFSLSLKVIFKARQFWSSKPQLVWISETQGLRNKWACSCLLLPFYPPSPLPLQMQTNPFPSDFSYKNMSASRQWLWNEEPQKSLTKLACGKADLSEGWNRTVIGAAFYDSYLPLLIGRWGCFMCSFPGVCAHCSLRLWYSHFARSFSKQQANWPCLNLFPKQNQSWEHSHLSFDGKRDFCACYFHIHSKTVTSK